MKCYLCTEFTILCISGIWGHVQTALNFNIHFMLTNMQHLLYMILYFNIYFLFSCLLAIVLLISSGIPITEDQGAFACIHSYGFRMDNIVLSDNKLM